MALLSRFPSFMQTAALEYFETTAPSTCHAAPSADAPQASLVPGSEAQRARTKMSVVSLVSPETNVSATEAKATNRPSAEIAGVLLSGLSTEPPGGTLNCVVLPATRSRTRI